VAGDGSQDEGDELRRRLYCEFQNTLRDPEEMWLTGKEAGARFGLTREDMQAVSFIVKESPYEPQAPPFKIYPLREVVELALEKHGEAKLLEDFWKRALPLHFEARSASGVYGYKSRRRDEERARSQPSSHAYARRKEYWYTAPSTTTVEGRQSVLQGLRTNVGICSVKGGVWFMTGSHVVFADLMHSIADVANYSYRLMELNRSARQRDASHPYGYAPLRYITADRSFVFLFFVGGICPLVTGLRELAELSVPACDFIFAPAAVFLVSAILEGAAVKAAYSEILSQAAKEKPPSHPRLSGDLGRVVGYLRHGHEVMSTATLTEATSGVLGAMVGLCGLAASWYLQSGVPDVVCSIVMASMVCGVGTFLMRKSGNALLGETLPSWRVEALVAKLEAHATVVNIYDVKTVMVCTDSVRFKAEVQFHPKAITERVLQAGLLQRAAPDQQAMGAELAAHSMAYKVICERLQDTLPMLSQAAADASKLKEAHERVAAVSPWLSKNNDLFYEALVWELKDLERIVRQDLADFRNVHIDLEPW